jgi:hypothetical protein
MKELVIRPVNINNFPKCCVDYSNGQSLSCVIPLRDPIWMRMKNQFHKEWALTGGLGGTGHFNFYIDQLANNIHEIANGNKKYPKCLNDIYEIANGNKKYPKCLNDILVRKENGDCDLTYKQIFSGFFGDVRGLLSPKFTNTSNVKRIIFHSKGSDIFKIENFEKKSEMNFPFSSFYMDGTMYAASYFYFELFDPNIISDIELTSIPMFLDETKWWVTELLGLDWFIKIPEENRVVNNDEKKEYMIITTGMVCLVDESIIIKPEILKPERPFSLTIWTRKNGTAKINSQHQNPTIDPNKLIVALYSWNLDEVISKFPQSKILEKVSDFELSTAPPAKDLVIASDALEEFKKIAKENDSSIGYIREYSYYTDEQKAANDKISNDSAIKQFNLYQTLMGRRNIIL